MDRRLSEGIVSIRILSISFVRELDRSSTLSPEVEISRWEYLIC